MDTNIIEEKRNQLNSEIRQLISVIDLIDGVNKEYTDYIANSLNEVEYLDQQIELVTEAKTRMVNIFKD